MECTIVGYGKLGRALSLELLSKGRLKQIVSSHLASTAEANFFQSNSVEIVPDVNDLKNPTYVTFLTVKDTNLSNIAEKLMSKFNRKLSGCIVLHCSGIYSDEILENLTKLGAKTASAHPLQTFYEFTPEVFKDIYWIVQSKYFDDIKPILELIGGKAIQVEYDENTRSIYHASAVVASNFLNLLLLFAKKLLSRTNLVPSVLIPLIKQTIVNNENNFDHTEFTPLTGPIIRSDILTIKKHFASMAHLPDYLEIYSSLVLSLSKIALLNQNISEQEFRTIEKLVSNTNFDETLNSPNS